MRRWLALAAGTLLGAACVPLAAAAVAAPGVLGQGHRILVLIACWVAAAGAATACLFAAPRRAAVVLILVLGVALRVVALPPKAPLSDDLYRYAWDGRVQAAGIDPYRYAPHDAGVASLRDAAWLWPPRTCPPDGHSGCSLINRAGVHTIYPPVAEAWFWLLDVTRVTALRDRGLEGAGLAVDLALLAVLLALLRRDGRDPRLIALWALSPLPVLEFVADAHVDGLALLLTLPALELARRRMPAAAGAVLALAVLVKLYPALLLPVLVAADPSVRRAARAVGAFVAVCVLGYLPHVLAVGTAVIGYLPGYLREEHYDQGTRYLLLADVGLRGTAASVAVVVVLLAVVTAVLLRRPPPLLGATWLYGTLLLLTTPVQPWYAVGLAGLGLVAGRPEWALVALAGYPIFVQTVLAAGNAVTVGRISYAVAAAVIAVCALLREDPGRTRRTGSRHTDHPGRGHAREARPPRRRPGRGLHADPVGLPGR